MRGLGKVAVTGVVAVSLGVASAATLAADDGYVRGYAAAVAEREFGVRPEDVTVRDGVVEINAPQLSPDQKARLADVLRHVRGVTDVRVAGAPAQTPSPAVGEVILPPATTVGTATGRAAVVPAPPPANPPAPVAPAAAAAVSTDPATPPAKADGVYVAAVDERYQLGLLPGKTLFDPLLADPRWPDTSATYRAYQNETRFDHAGATNFGGSLSIYRFDGPGNRGLSEVGLQAAVFGLFDLDAESHDLINADYFVALDYAYRIEKLSLLGRVLHQSSHVGDEFLLDHPGFQRINLTYEQINLLASYDLTKSWRVYGGGGWLFDTEPDNLDPWSIHYGVEYKADWLIANHIRPVAGVDFQQLAYQDWNLNLMVRAGVQFEGSGGPRANRLLLLLEYYTGHNPDGQFYTGNTQWWGLGLHWLF